MKNYLIILVLLFISCEKESILENIESDIYLYTQNDVDNFVKNHKYYKTIEINGDLYIGVNQNAFNTKSDISNLSGLSNIVRVNGSLEVHSNPLLSSNQGLHNIKYLSDLLIIKNNILIDINFDELYEIENHFVIEQNESLEFLNQFNSLNKVGGFINIRSNKSLEKISGINIITDIESLLISSNESLIEISNSFNTKKILYDLTMIGNSQLSKVDFFTNLAHIGRNLSFGKYCTSLDCGNENLTEISFKNLNYIGGDCMISRCPNLKLIYLNSVVNIKGSLTISELASFNDNLNFDSLEMIQNSLELVNLDLVAEIKSFHKLKAIRETLRITNNKKLKNITFEMMEQVNLFSLIGNPEISSCKDILPKIIELQGVQIEWNNNLNDFCSMKNLVDVAYSNLNSPLISIWNNGDNNTGVGSINNYNWIEINCN